MEMPPLAATTEVFPHRVATCVEKRVLQPGNPAEALRGRDCTPVLGESSKAVPAATSSLGRDSEKRDWSKDDVALEAAADGEWLEPRSLPGQEGPCAQDLSWVNLPWRAGKVMSLLIFSCSEPEPFVSLSFVKNDSYEKGNDLVVVHVYVKEIHKETSKVLFREQDFTLVFQTRYMPQDGARLVQSFHL